MVVAVATALACREAELVGPQTVEPISPQPARKEVPSATNSRVAKATLNLVKANYKSTKNAF